MNKSLQSFGVARTTGRSDSIVGNIRIILDTNNPINFQNVPLFSVSFTVMLSELAYDVLLSLWFED